MKRLKISLGIVALIIASVFSSCKSEKPINDLIVAGFSTNPEKPAVGQVVQFTPIAMEQGHFWDFGDGGTSELSAPTHIYQAVGQYKIKHDVIEANGNVTTAYKTIEVVAQGQGEDVGPGGVIKHSEDIKADETWSKKFVHIVTQVIDIRNATLTIEPGTLVKFEESAGLVFGYSEMQHSRLVAQGTADAHITFTTAKALTAAQPGDWDYIYFGEYSDVESIMEYCDISYGGGDDNASVRLNDKSITFNHNTVTKSASNGINCIGDAFFISFQDNEVGNCEGNAIYMENPSYVHTLSTPAPGIRSRIDNNSLHGIAVYGSKGLYKKGDFTWQNLGARYTIEGIMDIGSVHGTSLTIGEGTTIAFTEGSGIAVGYQNNKTGKLVAKGAPGKEIKFISETGASGGKWDYIYFGKSNAEGSLLDHCIIEDAGGDNSNPTASLILKETHITLTNSTIKGSAARGIMASSSGLGAYFDAFTGNTIQESVESSVSIDARWAHTLGTGNTIADDLYGIAVFGDFDPKKGEFHWVKQTCPYTIMDIMEVGTVQECTLIIDPGNQIQFAEGAGISVGYKNNIVGTLIAQGTATEKITFGPATSTGYWDYIYFGKGTGSGSKLEYCDLINGGDDNSNPTGTIIIKRTQGGEPTLSHCLIKNSKSNGIVKYKNTTPNISDIIYDNCTETDLLQLTYE